MFLNLFLHWLKVHFFVICLQLGFYMSTIVIIWSWNIVDNNDTKYFITIYLTLLVLLSPLVSFFVFNNFSRFYFWIWTFCLFGFNFYVTYSSYRLTSFVLFHSLLDFHLVIFIRLDFLFLFVITFFTVLRPLLFVYSFPDFIHSDFKGS